MSKKRDGIICLNCHKRVQYESQHWSPLDMIWTCKPKGKK